MISPVSSFARGEAIGTEAPVNHLRFVDPETVFFLRRQAGRVADGAIDIHGLAAAPADQMVVVVADPVLVKGGGAGRLDPPDEPAFHQHAERVIDRLFGNRADARPDILGDRIGRGMLPFRDRPHHGQTLGRDRDSMFSEQGGGIGHETRLGFVLE